MDTIRTECRVLAPNNILPNRQEATLLVVGAEGTGKHDLSLSILQVPMKCSLQILIANTLPLPEENAASRPRIDFICFLLNMVDRDSIQVVEKSLSLVDFKYFLGKACLLVTGVRNLKRITDEDQVTALAESFNLPIIFGEIKTEAERDYLAQRILNMVEIAAGFKQCITPLLLEACRSISS